MALQRRVGPSQVMLVLLLLPGACLAAMKAVTLTENRVNTYSKQPRLRIPGDGFEAVADESKLQV